MRSDQKEILEEGGFTLVTKSKRNRRRGSKTAARKAPTAELEVEPPEDCEEERGKILAERIKNSEEGIKNCDKQSTGRAKARPVRLV